MGLTGFRQSGYCCLSAWVETLCASCRAEWPRPGRFFYDRGARDVRICYLDESGTAELTGGTSHFILLGLSIQGETWKSKDNEITMIKRRFGLERAEIHSGWLTRRYLEQERTPNFETLGVAERREAVQRARDEFLVKKAALRGPASVQEDRKNFKKTVPYIHLTLAERSELLRQVAEAVGRWDDCRLFAECTDKRSFRGLPPQTPPYEEAFTQLVTRFHRFLEGQVPPEHGLLVQDHNETVARRLTELMRIFHERGTRWTDQIRLLVETPLFVDSQLTSMVQVADVCAYATRRYCEKRETELLDYLFPKFHQVGNRLVGIRHYTGPQRCTCRICSLH